MIYTGINNPEHSHAIPCEEKKVNTSSVEVIDNGVNFYDYDGTLLYSFTEEEVLATDENNNYTWQIPPLPDRTGENLTNDGWNWSIENIRNYIANYHWYLSVGCTYHTTDGITYIWWTVKEGNTLRKLRVTPTVANALSIDWGDGTAPDIVSSATDTTVSHTYEDYPAINTQKEFVVKIACSSGSFYFPGRICGSTDEENSSSLITKIHLSENFRRHSSYSFSHLEHLEKISYPSVMTATSSFTNVFQYCKSLKHINFSRTPLRAYDWSFYNCTNLESISWSDQQSMGTYNIYRNTALKHINTRGGNPLSNYLMNNTSIKRYKFRDATTTINSNFFLDCSSLSFVYLGDGVTTINASAFNGCSSLVELTIPASVTTIASLALSGLTSLKRLYLKPETPPSIQSNTLDGIPSDCSIYVPYGHLGDYASATNWDNYATQMREYTY